MTLFVRLLRRVALAAATFAASGAGAQTPPTLRLGHFPNITHVQALVARSFEREGRSFVAEAYGAPVKVEWFAYNAGPSAMEAIFAKAIDATYVGPNPALNAYARSRGAEPRVIGGAVNGGSALVVQPGAGLSKPSDFRGRKIATPQFGNTQDIAARAWLAAGGLRITQTGGDALVVPTQNPDQLALFQRKEIDAVWTVEPWVARLEAEAGGAILLEEKDAVTTVLAARTAFLQEQPKLAAALAEANRRLSDWIAKNPDEAARRAREELNATFRANLDAALVKRSFDRLTVSATTPREGFAKFVEAAKTAGFLRDAPALDPFFADPR